VPNLSSAVGQALFELISEFRAGEKLPGAIMLRNSHGRVSKFFGGGGLPTLSRKRTAAIFGLRSGIVSANRAFTIGEPVTFRIPKYENN
jgi:hypothetical protein